MLRRKNDFEERYHKFYQELKGAILSGKLKPGEFILPENTLSREYELSRVSIRKVLAELVEEGLIEKIPGKGNRVTIPEDHAKQIIKLAWFSGSYEIDIIQRIIQRYEEINPYVKIELQILPVEGYVNQLHYLVDQGHGPDVFIVSDYHFRELVETNRLHILHPFLPSHLDVERDSYQKVFDMFMVDGKALVTPFVFSPVVICYNKKIFQEVGIIPPYAIDDWYDLLKVAEQCTRDTDQDGLLDQYGFCFSSSQNRWPVFILQNNGEIMSADRTTPKMYSKENIEALQYCVDLMYRHKVSPIFTHGSNQLAEDLFMKQRAAMILTTYYFMNEFRSHDIEWDLLPVPRKKRAATLLLGGALAVNQESEMKEAAQAFVDFMVSPEAQRMLKQYGCTIPMLKSIAEDNRLLDSKIHPENYNAFIDVLPYAWSIRELNLTIKEIDMLQNELNLLWANMETPEETCRRIQGCLSPPEICRTIGSGNDGGK